MSQYAHFQRACGRPRGGFTETAILQWMVDYVRQGFTARSLPKRLSALSKYAEKIRAPFPDHTKGRIKEMRRALEKIDPTDPDRATVFTWYWIMKIMDQRGIRCQDDLRTCPMWECAMFARMLLVHDGCVRGCEHRSGLKLGDIVGIYPTHVMVKIAARTSEKKMKRHPARYIHLSVTEDRTSAGSALLIYLERRASLRRLAMVKGAHCFITVPPGARPGSTIAVQYRVKATRTLRFKLPPDAVAGQQIRVDVPLTQEDVAGHAGDLGNVYNVDDLHRNAQTILFPRILHSAENPVVSDQACSDKSFLACVKQWSQNAGMPRQDWLRLRGHSFRAGGATDWSVAGAGEEFIMTQGGWRSPCWLIYVRRARHHSTPLARRMHALLRPVLFALERTTQSASTDGAGRKTSGVESTLEAK